MNDCRSVGRLSRSVAAVHTKHRGGVVAIDLNGNSNRPFSKEDSYQLNHEMKKRMYRFGGEVLIILLFGDLITAQGAVEVVLSFIMRYITMLNVYQMPRHVLKCVFTLSLSLSLSVSLSKVLSLFLSLFLSFAHSLARFPPPPLRNKTCDLRLQLLRAG